MKILVIRFSSMGDIIYTTPVVRCIKKQVPNAEVHFLTKPAFKYIYDNTVYLDGITPAGATQHISAALALIPGANPSNWVDFRNNILINNENISANTNASTTTQRCFERYDNSIFIFANDCDIIKNKKRERLMCSFPLI